MKSKEAHTTRVILKIDGLVNKRSDDYCRPKSGFSSHRTIERQGEGQNKRKDERERQGTGKAQSVVLCGGEEDGVDTKKPIVGRQPIKRVRQTRHPTAALDDDLDDLLTVPLIARDI